MNHHHVGDKEKLEILRIALIAIHAEATDTLDTTSEAIVRRIKKIASDALELFEDLPK